MNDNRHLRILHTEASLGWGGQEIRILTESAKCAAMGHHLHLLCDPHSDIFAAANNYGIAATAVPLKRKSIPALLRVRKFLQQWQADIVNTHSSIDHWLTAAARIALPKPPCIVRTRHISAPVSRGIATRWLYNRGAESIMTTSRAIAAAFTEDGFLPANQVLPVPTGIDTAQYTPGDQATARTALGLPADVFIFVIVATLRSWKGHRYLLDAFARLLHHHPKTQLLIVGDGPQQQNLQKQIATLNIKDKVVMTGRQNNVVPYLQAADAFVLSSTKNEGVPQALLQAMACRLPPVATTVGGIPELIEGLPQVQKAKPEDVASLLQAMTAAINTPANSTARDALRQRVVQNFSIQTMADKVIKNFRRLTATERKH